MKEFYQYEQEASLNHLLQLLSERNVTPSGPSEAIVTNKWRYLGTQSRESFFAPLSFAQNRLWFLDQLVPQSPLYNIPIAWRVKGPLHRAPLEQGLNALAARHESLRTIFRSTESEPQQVLLPTLPIYLRWLDLQMALPETIQSILYEEARHPFDLTTGPLWRACVLQTQPEDFIFLITMHHIISDDWSVAVLTQELTIIYNALVNNQPVMLPPLPFHYADFTLWQRDYLQGSTLETLLAYWRKHLAQAPPLLELPADHPRPSVQTFRGATHAFHVSFSLTQAVQTLSQQEGVTLFMTLLTAFYVVLSRYSSQQDLVIGTPIAGRGLAETEGLIGFFVNTLPIRVDLAGNPTFQQALQQIRHITLEAYAHQDLPFGRLGEELAPQHERSFAPLVQVAFALQNVPEIPLLLKETQTERLEVETGLVPFDLLLELREVSDGLEGALRYSTDLFEPSTMERFAAHFQMLLHGVVIDPSIAITQLPLLPALERQLVLETWNATESDYPKEQTLPQLFEAQVERTPDAIAVLFADHHLTYQRLNEEANGLAGYLREQGVGPEELVGLCVERSLEMVVALLGILKAGGAYVPLDPMYPKERLAFMLQDSQIRILLTQETLRHVVPENDAEIVYLGNFKEKAFLNNTDNYASKLTASNLSYVIYTSGSTGKPKGVQIQHFSLINLLYSMQKNIKITENDVLLAVTTLSFDIAALEFFLPLIVGARLVIANREATLDGRQLAERLKSTHTTIMQATPTTWRLLLDARWSGSEHHLKILCGGEALSRELAYKLLSQNTSLWNVYGPTETTIFSCIHQVCSEDLTIPIAPIGRPIANTQIYILDQYLQPVPIGVPGELYIGGDGLARGYLKQPDLTRERFLSHSLDGINQLRLYKTGDWGRYHSRGIIEFLGRIDYQVKIRGFRIELGEIETALNDNEAVRDALVLLRENAIGEKYLVAYVISEVSTSVPSSSHLRSYLKERLPDYMLPAYIIFLEAFPLTPNGKVDRQALPLPNDIQRDADSLFVAPRDSLETILAGIFSNILGQEQIGVFDNFFSIGGNSLSGSRVISHIFDIFGVNLSLSVILEKPTIAELKIEIISKEKKAGQTLKIARILEKVQSAPSEEIENMLKWQSKKKGF